MNLQLLKIDMIQSDEALEILHFSVLHRNPEPSIIN